LSLLFPKSTSTLLVLVVFRVVPFSADWIAQYFEGGGDSAEFFVRVRGWIFVGFGEDWKYEDAEVAFRSERRG
jgi:hypothetical protein